MIRSRLSLRVGRSSQATNAATARKSFKPQTQKSGQSLEIVCSRFDREAQNWNSRSTDASCPFPTPIIATMGWNSSTKTPHSDRTERTFCLCSRFGFPNHSKFETLSARISTTTHECGAWNRQVHACPIFQPAPRSEVDQ